MKLTTNILISLLCLFFGFQFTQAQCDGTNDLIQSDGGRNYTLNPSNGLFSTGNSFIGTCSGTIDGISFWTGEIPGTIGGVSVTVELYRNPFNSNRVLLASRTNDIPFSNNSNARENYFSFDNDPQLVAGTLYGFRIINNENNQSMEVKFNSTNNANPYAGGRQFTNNFEQTIFTQNRDLRFQIHYEDQVAPIANCRNITRTLNANGTVNINANNINNNSSDADSGLASFSISQNSFDCSNIGDNTVTLSVFDQNGNSSNCQAIVTIVDETPPVLTCPSNITVANTSPGASVIVNYADIIYEDCTIETPAGYTFLAARNGKSYFLSQNQVTPSQAFLNAEVLGGHLATIENQEDNDFIRSAVDAIINTNRVIIGYTDSASEGNFVWHSGSTATYTNWNNGEPNNDAGNEDYTEITSTGKWNDTWNNTPKYYIIELSQPNITQTNGFASGASFPVGITTNTFEATDAFGYTTTCSFTVEVVESSKIIHVDAAAVTNGNGQSWGTAYKYLQDALADANNDANNFSSIEIWVANGVYYPDEDQAGNVTNNNRNATFQLRNKVSLLGGFNGTETSKDQRNPEENITILSGDIGQDDTNTDGNTIAENSSDIMNNNSFHVVTGSNADTTAIIDGFTITAGDAGNQNGGGMLINNGSPQVNQIHFIGNTANYGGAMYLYDCSSTITNTKYTSNHGTGDSGAVEISQNNVNSLVTFTNILFVNNISGNNAGAVGVFPDGFNLNVNITNATFYGNTATGSGGAVYSRFANRIDIKNSIFYNNSGQDVVYVANDAWNVSYSYLQETYTYPGGSNNLQNQPNPFVDAANGNFQLKSQSTAIDAGDTTANSSTLDLANNPRTYNDNFVTDTGNIGGGTAVIDMGAYERQENSSEVIYVNTDAATNGNGNSWGTAYKYLQDALQDASSNASNFPAIEIWVAEGVYYPDEDEGGNVSNNNRNATFALQSKVILLGGFNGTETSKSERDPEENITILSGDTGQDDTNTDGNTIAENVNDIMNNNSFHVVTGSNTDTTAVIDGFTITAGDAGNQNAGGMIVISGSPQVNQLRFIGNTAASAGALYLEDSSSTVTNTKFISNTTTNDSGAVEVLENNANSNLNLTFTNILFANNTAGNNGGGIGVYGFLHTYISITNATFYGNTASANGGAVFSRFADRIDIKNSIFYNNSGQDVYFTGNDAFNVSHSYLQETYTYPGGSNNLQNQPNPFVDASNGDFQLKNQSTAIDAGNNTANNLTIDVAGNPRTYNDTFITDTGNIGSGIAVIDMGAYERQEDSCNDDTNNDGICDNEDPVAVCQDISLEIDFGGITVTADQLDGGSTDNIGISEMLINGETSIDLTYDAIGDTEVTITVVDGDGNTADCTATITVTTNVNFDIFISEYQPVVNSQNTDQQIELIGQAGEAFAGTLVVIEGDVQTGNEGVVVGAYDFSGTFDTNNLLVATIPNIPDPTHTVVLTTSFNGTVGATNVDNGDGTVDTSAFGTVLDAIGSTNGAVCCPIDVIYGTAFGGVDLTYIGSRPYSVFREASTGDFYQLKQDGTIYDSTANLLDGSLFNTTPTTDGTFGVINPSRLIVIRAKVYLQGATLNPNAGQEHLMRDDLRVANLLPTASPYGDISTDVTTFSDVEPNNAIVDWVWVELRDENDNTNVISAQSALLQRDGDVVAADGTSALSFDALSGNYFIVIKHRNHLGIMSANTIALSATATTVDFTDHSTPTFGTNAQTSAGMPQGIVAMWTGNVNNDAIIQYSGTSPDSPNILSLVLNDAGNFLNFPTFIVSGYNVNDIDLNGNTQYSGTNPDTPILLQNVLAHPENFLNFSTYQIKEQLPENE